MVATVLESTPAPSPDPRAREDARLARWLFFATLALLPLSAPMFLSHFRAATAAAPPGTPSIPVFLVLELVKVALFSATAVWAGKKAATRAGIDAPVLRALLRKDRAAATRAVRGALTLAIPLGALCFAASIAIRSPFEGKTIGQLLALADDRGAPLVRLTGVFYGAAVELWFRWGALALASRGVSRLTGLSAARAFPVANVLAALAYGTFAVVSVWGPHAGEPGASRYVLEALLGYGLPSAFLGMAVRRHGFESAIFAMTADQLVSVGLRALL
jgi:hypothetical protein